MKRVMVVSSTTKIQNPLSLSSLLVVLDYSLNKWEENSQNSVNAAAHNCNSSIQCGCFRSDLTTLTILPLHLRPAEAEADRSRGEGANKAEQQHKPKRKRALRLKKHPKRSAARGEQSDPSVFLPLLTASASLTSPLIDCDDGDSFTRACSLLLVLIRINPVPQKPRSPKYAPHHPRARTHFPPFPRPIWPPPI